LATLRYEIFNLLRYRLKTTGGIGGASREDEHPQGDEEEDDANVCVLGVADDEEVDVTGDVFHGRDPYLMNVFGFRLRLKTTGGIGGASGEDEHAQGDEEENDANVGVLCVADDEEVDVASDIFHGGAPFIDERFMITPAFAVLFLVSQAGSDRQSVLCFHHSLA
jgi:hypothetical protein